MKKEINIIVVMMPYYEGQSGEEYRIPVDIPEGTYYKYQYDIEGLHHFLLSDVKLEGLEEDFILTTLTSIAVGRDYLKDYFVETENATMMALTALNNAKFNDEGFIIEADLSNTNICFYYLGFETFK